MERVTCVPGDEFPLVVSAVERFVGKVHDESTDGGPSVGEVREVLPESGVKHMHGAGGVGGVEGGVVGRQDEGEDTTPVEGERLGPGCELCPYE